VDTSPRDTSLHLPSSRISAKLKGGINAVHFYTAATEIFGHLRGTLLHWRLYRSEDKTFHICYPSSTTYRWMKKSRREGSFSILYQETNRNDFLRSYLNREIP